MSLPRSSRTALRLRCQFASHHQLQLQPRQPRFQQLAGSRRTVANLTHTHQAAAITRIQTNVDPTSEEFKENEKSMAAVMARIETLSQQIQKGGPEKARQKHLQRKKMLPRDRVTALIDPGTTFLELAPMAGYELYPEAEVPAGGIIAGVGVVEGVSCMIVANDSTVKEEHTTPLLSRSIFEHRQSLRRTSSPASTSLTAEVPTSSPSRCIPRPRPLRPHLLQPGPHVRPGYPPDSVVMGPCTAGGAYVPAMSDESIIVGEQGHIFLAGPPLVKAATGEEISAEDLGGGKMHSSVSGVTDYLAVDDAHAITLARRSVSNLNWPKATSFSSSSTTSSASSSASTPGPSPTFSEPLFDPEELLGIATTNLRKPMPIREVIARVVDGSHFSEFKRDFGTTLVTGFASIYGHKVGIVANDGILFPSSAQKGAHFIELCAQRAIPLVFLQNISGFMVGSAAEHEGIAKHGAKLVTAVACADVPKFTVVVGGSYGAGNYGMCGRAYSPRFLWMWPNARIGVMGGEQLAAVMETVGKKADPELRDRIDRESDATFSSARLWDDGIIPPQHTRKYLGLGLQAALGGRNEVKPGETKFGVFRM
uniref:methylcrotonoyl-CoA carboxylase n=1 Tax=Bionectria ochroleuca TaxID=29856 RepID=A0A8H7NKD6_BIOOC